MSIIWVDPNTPLPEIKQTSPHGLVAAGADLSTARLLEAYRKGMFPWYSPGEPVLWWSPDPRMLLICGDLHISHSLAKRVRQFDRPPLQPTHPAGQAGLAITLNTAFDQVITHCAQRNPHRLGLGAARHTQHWPAPAAPQPGGTWITPDIRQTYRAWHHLGYAHSVETWINGQLAGGLYGVCIGRCFFGESMFSLATDTSKVALAYLVRFLMAQGIPWIDCQQETPHLASLGAQAISRDEFLSRLAQGRDDTQLHWPSGRLTADGRLIPLIQP
ncbi:leucyl/phenylalanyl-tRNA--protein transferase [Castellaniella sp.]|uniref:leucyl/phenylalanyl-tRNA--protein transferase n=1 Tax=Castellaniella sp. TaxID=1955812 RepID=UPI003A92ADF4